MAWQDTDFRSWMESAKFSSFDHLARELLKRWPGPAESLPKERSLSVKLGRFAKGQTQWFRENPEIGNILADLLGQPVEVLLPNDDAPKWDFPEFPQLRPLDLRQEDLCDVAVLEVAGHSHKTYPWPVSWLDGAVWIHGPPGAGKHLYAHWRAARHGAVVREVERLWDARGIGANTPASAVIICVANADPAHDDDTLRELAARGQVTVLAPFPLPVREEKVGTKDDDEPQPGNDSVPKTEQKQVKWTSLIWRPHADWRLRFLCWVQERLGGDSLFDAEQLHSWLQAHDPAASLFKTPGDLLPLCALGHEKGERWLRRKDVGALAEALLEGTSQGSIGDAHGDTWLRGSGATALRALARGRLFDLDLPLRGGTTRESWAQWLPADLLVPPTQDVKQLQHHIEALLAVSAEERQRRIKKLTERLTQPASLDAIEFLVRGKFLRADESGGLSLYPRFAAEIWTKAAVAAAVTQEDPTLWGRWMVDSQRRQLVDEALVSMPEQEFLTLIEKTLGSTAECLGRVGAVEALFAAVGLRLDAGWRGPDEVLHELWRQALHYGVRRSYIPVSLPLTRLDWPSASTIAYYASCWSWSFHVPAPPDLPIECPGWLWPGWRTPSLSEIPNQALWGAPSWAQDDPAASVAFDRLLAMAPRFLGLCQEDELPERLGYNAVALSIDALIMSATGEKKWSPKIILNLNHGIQGWKSKYLAEKIFFLTIELKNEIMKLLYENQGFGHPSKGGYFFYFLRDQRKSLYDCLVPALSPETFSKIIKHQEVSDLLIGLSLFPENLQETVEQICINNSAINTDYLISMTSRTHSDKPIIGAQKIRFFDAIAKKRTDYDWQLTQTLWGLAPVLAQEHARQTWTSARHERRTQHWFHSAPRKNEILVPLLRLVDGTPLSERPPWVAEWLAALLLNAGGAADAIYSLLRGGPFAAPPS